MDASRPPSAVLIDIAGVLQVEDQPIAGAVDGLRALRGSGLPLRFLTNTTRTPRSRIVASLRQAGFAVEPEEVQTAVHATRRLVAQRRLRPYYLVHPDIADEVGPSHPEPDAVVVGDAGPYFTFEAMNRAFRLLMAGHPLIAMARGRYFRERDGLSLDAGAFVCGLEFASGVVAEVVGKPAAAFFQSALDELGVAPERAVLIGDDLNDDIGGAQAAGIPGILVRTGKFRAGDEDHPLIRPAAIRADFAAAVDYILSARA